MRTELTWGNGRNFKQERSLQTIDAYENDPIVKYLIENIGRMDRHGFTTNAVAELMDVRERLYPKLFNKSINEMATEENLTIRIHAYLQTV